MKDIFKILQTALWVRIRIDKHSVRPCIRIRTSIILIRTNFHRKCVGTLCKLRIYIFFQRHQVEMFEKKGSKSGFMKILAQTISAMLNTVGGTIYFGNIHYFGKCWK
jgi:hypothetical protein